ncbi:outer membrane protein assembly factor BamE [Billgrantia endophytica]|uniref:Outer membrane protein assembly factor BamE n=1 Tax=Billgrantia endophytica TaxID=2033802 RepID=A0A2N7U6D3_9GAMM|nr:outer membrane protein assembly factor BamE [Halomonas endophytica]PMR75982.1 outer membrane protein assembly factor BamE [Halomonas endophytica]
MQKLIKIATLTLALTLASGCVYKRDLPQGNYITEGMVEQLQPGMSREQVINVMGRPLLEAPFDANQWDYIFRLDEAYGGVQQRRVSLTFANGQLTDIEQRGDMSEDIQLRPEEGMGPASEEATPMEELPATQPEAVPETAPGGGTTMPQGGVPATGGGEPAAGDQPLGY